MINGKSVLAIIPARGGSKGLLRKNIRPLLDKPLIAWTIEEAKKSKYIDTLIVSTDDEEIAEVSKIYNADVPFLRPADLAADSSATIDVLIHALDWFRKRGNRFDYLVLLEPTSPLREAKDIDICIEKLLAHKSAISIVSVALIEQGHPEYNVIIDDKTGLVKKIGGATNFNILRRQDLSNIYFFDGTIYISEVEGLFLKKTFYHELTMSYIVPKWKSYEVDDFVDLLCIEAIMKANLAGILT